MNNSYTSNEFLFSFKGRINRAKYWYAAFASGISCLFFLLVLALVFMFGVASKSVHVSIDIFAVFNNPPSFPLRASYSNPPASAAFSLLFNVAGTPIMVVGIWFFTATTVKRLHDRNKSGWWMIPFYIASGLYSHLKDRLPDTYAVGVLGVVAFVLCLWGLVELLCLRGTRGPNRFGPDPLAPSDTRPPWEQQSELEFVPHRAGPSA
jgi:uncharacterized membrane protein YhaH (DUF805 family)